MKFIVILLFLFIYLANCRIKDEPKSPPRPPEDARMELHEKCGSDIDTYCANDGPMLAIYCLYAHKDQLSSSCQEYLGSTTVGGCNDEAKSICGEYDDAEDIMNCLEEHRDELSADCLRNIENAARDPWRHLEESTLQSTKIVTRFSVIFLSFPIILAIYAVYKMRNYAVEEETILKANPRVWKENSEIIEVLRACDSVEEARGSKHPWCIRFHAIDYWVQESESWLNPNKVTTKRILSNVSGQFEASKVTAIMGPSGSGKTTLLKLLGGQMFSGEFKGIRAINDVVPVREKYDKLMRAQGFVAQYDCLLPSLTVWQTLKYAALLRLPEEMTPRQKFYRAAHIMDDVGIAAIAHNHVGNLNGVQSTAGQSASKSISGGQRRRLSIALELLANPSIILLDEPTSGLDGASTLKIVTSLHKLSRSYNTTICLTVHQPRAEVFDLFDNLLLLGAGGKMIYYGPTSEVVALFSASPILNRVAIKFDNPGDFIIDMLDLSDDGLDTSVLEEQRSPSNAEHTANDTVGSPIHREGGNDKNQVLSDYFYSTDSYLTLLHQLKPIIEIAKNSVTHGTMRQISFFNRMLSNLDNRMTEGYNRLNQEIDDSRHDDTEGIELSTLRNDSNDARTASTPPSPAPPASPSSTTSTTTSSFTSSLPPVFSWSSSHEDEDNSSSLRKYYPYGRKHPTSMLSQILTIFGRRVHAFTPSIKELGWLLLQMLVVAVVVSITFSYQTTTSLESPYQVLMIISMISLYTMILQYLQLIPEYMAERQLIINECFAGYMSLSCYMIAAMLTEIPRAILYSLYLMGTVYVIHPLNPNPIKRAFSYVCLMVGTTAFQGLISICATLTDSIGVSYSISFLILSSGTIFGGIMVPLNKIILPFRFFYYTSVAAITQRALITNDMECCYLTATCNKIDNDYDQSNSITNSTTTYCPPELEFTGDGSDIGNLGRAYLLALDLQEDRPFVALLTLFIASVFFRMIVVFILHKRLLWKDQLKEIF